MDKTILFRDLEERQRSGGSILAHAFDPDHKKGQHYGREESKTRTSVIFWNTCEPKDFVGITSMRSGSSLNAGSHIRVRAAKPTGKDDSVL